MLELVVAGEGREQEKLASMRSRAAQTGAEIQRSVAAIMEEVRARGYEAVEEYSVKFDQNPPREVSMEELEQAAGRIAPDLLAALQRSAQHIRAYQQELLSEVQMGLRLWDSPSGGKVGRLVRPLQRVGVYVPGGRAAYPSSVLMNVIPAKVAGVEEVIMVTPPTENLSDVVLAAAWVAGVDRCIAVGGAQAVAALTYGAGFIPRVDKLVGPGNAFVAEAKRMAYGNLDIDMVAGPSEVLVIADQTANPCHMWSSPCGTSAAPSSAPTWRPVQSWPIRWPRSTWRSSQRTPARCWSWCTTPGPSSWAAIPRSLWETTWLGRTTCCLPVAPPDSSPPCRWTPL